MGDVVDLPAPAPPEVDEVAITEPGVYGPDLVRLEAYVADPVKGGSLSASGAKLLLPPSCPALFRYRMDHPEPPQDHFDFGHAAHTLVLGAGPEIVPVDADDWRTKDARQQRDDARAGGLVPLLRRDYETVHAMAAAIRAHPLASILFDPGRGHPEVTMVWPDDGTGVWRRGRLDWLPDPRPGSRLIVADYKTARSASPEVLSRAAADYGFPLQAATYLDGIMALGIDEDPAMVFVCQDKQPPYPVTIVELDETALRIGRQQAREALRIYAECSAADAWPSWSDDVVMLSLPAWYQKQHDPEDW